MNVSAVILSAGPVERQIRGVAVVPFISNFSEAQGLMDARLASLEAIKTEWFFWLDDDDELPSDYERILSRCTKSKTPLAYTDELINDAKTGISRVRRSKRYSQDEHIERDMLLIHHLAVCRTEAAIDAAKRIPRGLYAVENLLFFEVAKKGATYINEVGYIWNRSATGLSRDPSLTIALVQSATWAHRNRS